MNFISPTGEILFFPEAGLAGKKRAQPAARRAATPRSGGRWAQVADLHPSGCARESLPAEETPSGSESQQLFPHIAVIHMAVDIEGDACGGVTHQVLHAFDIQPAAHQCRAEGMP